MLTAATAFELKPSLDFLLEHYPQIAPNCFKMGEKELHIIISGVGMMQTAFCLGQKMAQNNYDSAIQAGIAGSFDSYMPLGTLTYVTTEQYGDLGAEDKEKQLDMFDLGLLQADAFPFQSGKLPNKSAHPWAKGLLPVQGLSVNMGGGQLKTIQDRAQKYQADIESMEGIAFHYACLMAGIPFAQIRAISNFIEPRNRAAWQIETAITNLNQHLCQQIESFFNG